MQQAYLKPLTFKRHFLGHVGLKHKIWTTQLGFMAVVRNPPSSRREHGRVVYMMADEPFPIILVDYNSNRSQRDVELESSRLKSHAARISYAHRKTLRSSKPLAERKRKLHQHDDRDPSICCTCNHPLLQHAPQARSLTRKDPFSSYAGHDLPAICHDALEYSTSLSGLNWSKVLMSL